MKILYLSVHAVLEFDEISLFTELGHEVFSSGAYIKPQGHHLLPRPAIKDMKEHPDLEKYATEYPKTNMPQELIDWANVIVIMHDPNVVEQNWGKMKHKKIVWRSIGQSTPHVENQIRRMQIEGMKIVRMSPMEENIIGYCGSDALIRFYKDPEEWSNWNGKEKRVINFTQTLKGRHIFCHYDHIMQIIEGFPALIYGSGNEDLGGLNGGELPYDLMKGALRDNRVYIYGGTWPSPYTLSFIEPLMSGIPMVAIGSKLAEEIVPESDRIHFYEIPDIIKNEKSGFVSDDINQLREYVGELLRNESLAKAIGDKGRETATKLFSKEEIKSQWADFFKTLE